MPFYDDLYVKCYTIYQITKMVPIFLCNLVKSVDLTYMLPVTKLAMSQETCLRRCAT